jgi:hypothetical protein
MAQRLNTIANANGISFINAGGRPCAATREAMKPVGLAPAFNTIFPSVARIAPQEEGPAGASSDRA